MKGIKGAGGSVEDGECSTGNGIDTVVYYDCKKGRLILVDFI